MLKIYYIVLAVIMALVSWLVFDFIQNSAEARDIIVGINNTEMPKGPGPIPVLLPALPVLPQGNFGEIFKPRVAAAPMVDPAAPVRSTFNYIVTAIIMEPNGAIAFIVNPTKNEERICKVGDRIDEWDIILIDNDEVVFRDRSGNIKTIQVQRQWGGSRTEKGSRLEIPPQIVSIPGAEEMIKKVMDGKGTTEVVEQYIDAMAKTLPAAFIRDFIKQNTGLSDEDMPKDDSKLGEYSKNIFRLFQGEEPVTVQGQAIEGVLFTLRVNPDNSPITPQSVFKPGDRRIYACFQNLGSLKGLTKLVHRWTNKTTKEIFNLETKSIDPAALYNFTWVEKRGGWPSGEYEVELLKPQTFERIGFGKFSIVP